MTDSITHRGPDDEGFLFVNDARLQSCRHFSAPDFTPTYALGHRRLSIIDLTGGLQPQCNENETVWITFNGEIYNHMELRLQLLKKGHHFKTHHSDTETIIHAYEQWGVSAFDRLNGIFAFAILDLSKRVLILVRDHFGVKPLYYFLDGTRLIFASEIKAILECRDVDRTLDQDALRDYLAFRYVPSPQTVFRNIYKLEAGGYLEFDLQRHRILSSSSYDTRPAVQDHSRSLCDWVSEYQAQFEAAVKRQLISDVEVGALLSGGVDSSAVSAVAAQQLNYPLRTYTIGFKDFPEGNELEEAEATAKYLGTKHTNIIIDVSDFIQMLEKVAWFMDEPTATSSTVSLFYLTRAVSKEVKVVLTGQGADEPLAGYHRYWGERLYSLGFKHLGILQPIIERLPRQERVKRAFRSFREHDTFARFMRIYDLFNPDQMRSLLKDHSCIHKDSPLMKRLFDGYTPRDTLGCMLYIDTRTWLPDDLMICGDKASMINSVEARVPMLDKDFVHFIETIPSKYKLTTTLQNKYIHKRACAKWLPRYVIDRPKKGFPTPIDKWFRKELKMYVRDQLLGGKIARLLYRTSFIEEMLAKHQSGREDFQRHLFALLMLEQWASVFRVTV